VHNAWPLLTPWIRFEQKQKKKKKTRGELGRGRIDRMASRVGGLEGISSPDVQELDGF
jgi:hypothetical protein